MCMEQAIKENFYYYFTEALFDNIKINDAPRDPSFSEIIDYAEVCGEIISVDEAELIRFYLRKLISGAYSDLYYNIEEPLLLMSEVRSELLSRNNKK